LNTIEVHWNDDYIDYLDSDGQWAECVEDKIRLCSEDVDREFLAQDVNLQDWEPPSAVTAASYRTGVAGRPSSKQLAEQEMQRRAEQGVLAVTLAEEVRQLRDWLKGEHPTAPHPKQSALQNALRDQYRKLKQTPSSK
jgi:hypothetical protein